MIASTIQFKRLNHSRVIDRKIKERILLLNRINRGTVQYREEIKIKIEELMDVEDMCNPSRKRKYVLSRQLYYYMVKERFGFSVTLNSMALINQDHSTVIHGIESISNILSTYVDHVINDVYVELKKMEF